LGIAKRIYESRWKYPKAIAKPLGNLKGYRKATGKGPNTSRQPIGEEVELPNGCRQNVEISILFP
jgi:hypothetical protein